MIDRHQLAEAGFTSDDAGTTWAKKLPDTGNVLECVICGGLLAPLLKRKLTVNGLEMTIIYEAQEGDTAKSIAQLLDFDFILPNSRGAVKAKGYEGP